MVAVGLLTAASGLHTHAYVPLAHCAAFILHLFALYNSKKDDDASQSSSPAGDVQRLCTKTTAAWHAAHGETPVVANERNN